ncbi:MAG: TrmH family RNA methyltransferase [Acutalibacteraceae bacterium]
MSDFKSVTSRENSLIKLVSFLQTSAKKRRESGLFVLEGLRICLDAMENSIRFDKLIVSETALLKQGDTAELFARNSAECYKIPDSLFLKISDTKSPQGIIAVCKILDRKSSEVNPQGRYVALENVADPANLGAVSRTAEALGADGLILSSDGCDPYSPKALRASMGTLLRVPVFIFESFSEEISNTGLKSFACVVDKNAESIIEQEFCDGSVVIIGNEANGITGETKAAADKKVTIPMRGRAESLNAAAAAAIAIWEMMK